MSRTAEQIRDFLASNQHRMDLPQQYIGTEPNAWCKDWDSTDVRWLIMASWPYEQAAGNQSIPTVYKSVNTASPRFLADRFYLPATPRDLRMLERSAIPVFGIETKHQASDFDVVGTSISYPVLIINFIKHLAMSEIPLRWKDREPEKWPMVIVGGQSYGAPEALAPVVDCWWLGEVEDEPGNPGIASVTQRIADFKECGAWQTERVECYKLLAQEFYFLYFPRFIDVHYEYENRERTIPGGKPSKQVIGVTSNLPGMKMPRTKRHVKDMNNIVPLTDQPLLYVDPGLGAGDLEAARGCPAFCNFCALCLSGSTEFIARQGVLRLDEHVGETHEVWTRQGWQKAEIGQYGIDRLNKITFAPAHLGWSYYAQREVWKKNRGNFTVEHEATALHRWPLVDGTETHHLQVGDFVVGGCVADIQDEGQYWDGWRHGMTFGDGTHENKVQGDRSNAYAVLIRVDRPEYVEVFEKSKCEYRHNHGKCMRPLCVVSVTQVTNKLYRLRMNSRVKLKEFPAEQTSDYVRGFIEGWDAADGNERARQRGTIRINSQLPGVHEWFSKYASYGGWQYTGFFERKSLKTNYGIRKNPVREFNLSRSSAWKVVSLDEGVERVPVYCATVPGVGFFTLSTGVDSGNTFRQKPFRQASVEHLVEAAKDLKKNMGTVHISPFAPDFPMYTERKRLISGFLDVCDEVNASTMRVDDFISDPECILLQAHAGLDTVTLGVEGNSQRMRDLVGKGCSDEDIKEAVTRGIRAGINKFKLYMISNLPGEDEGDIYRILKLGMDLADIRDALNRPTVRIQFSWTPLLIEGNTPMQWFAPPTASRSIGNVWEKFRELKIEFKLGGKSEPNRLAFFQLCQRASRDIGEAIVDLCGEINETGKGGCWGGVPKHVQTRLDELLKQRGFLNGFDDAFDERFKRDMFGTEHISQGVSIELMWRAYQQTREFVENTDSHTYDQHFNDDYHGSEWIERCDTHCYGKACGACDTADLKIRKGYIRAARNEFPVDLNNVQVVDQKSQVVRVRARVEKGARLRMVMNDHWRFAFRRACYRAEDKLGTDFTVAKRSVRFVSDELKYKDWTCGRDYLEFGVTRKIGKPQMQSYIDAVNENLDGMQLTEWSLHPGSAPSMRTDIDLSLWELEIDDEVSQVLAKIRQWEAVDYVKVVLKQDWGYFAAEREEFNAKDFCEDIWLARAGHSLVLRMLLRGRPSPYNIYAALMGRTSWIEAARNPAIRIEAFVPTDRDQYDFFRVNCEDCERQIQFNVMNEPFDAHRCPRCKDRFDGIEVHEVTFA